MTKHGYAVWLALAGLAAPTTVFAVDDAAVLRCRAITDAAPRLACYDALPVAAPAAATSRTGAAAAAVPAPAAAAAAAAVPPAQRNFGLPSDANAPDDIESSIAGAFQGWDPDDQITLANGQVWSIVDGSRAFVKLTSPRVRVVKGVLGAFFLEVEGMNQRPRVRRVR